MTPTQRQALDMALEALEQLQGGCTDNEDGTVEAITVWCPEVIEALRAALAEQDDEKADAERYRWLRNMAHPDEGPAVAEHHCNDLGKWYYQFPSGEELDAAIDAARSKP